MNEYYWYLLWNLTKDTFGSICFIKPLSLGATSLLLWHITCSILDMIVSCVFTQMIIITHIVLFMYSQVSLEIFRMFKLTIVQTFVVEGNNYYWLSVSSHMTIVVTWLLWSHDYCDSFSIAAINNKLLQSPQLFNQTTLNSTGWLHCDGTYQQDSIVVA